MTKGWETEQLTHWVYGLNELSFAISDLERDHRYYKISRDPTGRFAIFIKVIRKRDIHDYL